MHNLFRFRYTIAPWGCKDHILRDVLHKIKKNQNLTNFLGAPSPPVCPGILGRVAEKPASHRSIAAALRRSSGSRLSRACRGELVEGEAAPAAFRLERKTCEGFFPHRPRGFIRFRKRGRPSPPTYPGPEE